VNAQRHAPAALPLRNDPVPIVQKAEWASWPFWTGAENLAPTGIRSPDRTVCSELLYQLRYPGQRLEVISLKISLDKKTQNT
jgi:hypothetical protein